MPDATPGRAQRSPWSTWLRSWQRVGARQAPSPDSLRRQEASRLLFAGVVVGALGGLVAWAFDHASVALGGLLLGSVDPSTDAPTSPWILVGGPVAAGAIAGPLLHLLTRGRRPQGVADVLERVQLDHPSLSMRDGMVSAAAAAVIVGGGHSGGREGPIVQAAGALAARASERLGVRPADVRALVAAGAAAGIAASFNTPLGGTFFALEIILGSFTVEAFAPVVAATVTGTVVGQALLGDHVALTLPPFVLRHPVELVFYLVLGALSAAVAWALKHAVVRLAGTLASLPVPTWSRPAWAGLGVGLIAWAGMTPVMGNGYGYIEQLLAGHGGSLTFVSVLLVAKLAATMMTAAGRAGAGLFAPSLFVGAVAGTLFGMLVQRVWPGHAEAAGAYGMVGMGAVAAAVMSAPITMTLMLFEMTGNYQVILPLLLSLSVAGVVSSSFRIRSVYEMQLDRRGVVLGRGHESTVLQQLTVADLMRTDGFDPVRDDAPVADLVEHFLERDVDRVHVIDADGAYVRTIDLKDVKGALADPEGHDHLRAGDLALPPAPALFPSQTLAAVLPSFFETGQTELPVLDPNRRVIGVLLERDIVAAYHREGLRHTARGAHAHAEGERRLGEIVDLPKGQVVEVVDLPASFAGRTLRELALPTRYGCTVLAIAVWDAERRHRARVPADPERALGPHDRLVVMGPQDGLDALLGRRPA